MDKKNTPIVILCGGRGLILDASGRRQSKGLIPVCRQQPIVRFVMQLYLKHGFDRFILAAGYQCEDFVRYFKDVAMWSGDSAAKGRFNDHEFALTIVDTGLETTTGDRIAAVAQHLDEAEHFGVTYCDTLSDINLSSEFEFHKSHGRIATLAGARIPTRFRILGLRAGEHEVRGFASKPVIQNDLINGGFYFFSRPIFDAEYLGRGHGLVLEEVILEALAREGQLMAYPLPSNSKWFDLDSERSLSPIGELAATFE